ncbi:Gfo/Idh/MocA family oxidoreductase [Salmonella enterica subsp. houtenae]|nr:Gfo/Idh/MocA family oxidoreductase [Salmonella enterica subsp. houtenae]EIJ5074803.1 Gfo/Idh/MocA family oxidoreductase [Salmonella enterica]EKT1269523.1 Gfo/Idh/MocA family oxidoreductase [Salmonella enterica]EKT1698792.1 Gfo/Idh/MocA family oxidoreductase [Salmonella enterica]EKT3188261.1 Gfo/Idh/MocA family oxidoreductase [Salmonella enterica]
MMTKYGVVGTGYFGAELARFMSKVEGAQITAIYDPVNADPIVKELNCVATATMAALCTHPDVDCVIIASPNYLHKAPVITAAKAGKHVFCEKPIALNYQDCKEMVDTCKEAGVIFMAGHVMNFFNGVRHAKALIKAGEIGEVTQVHTKRNGFEDVQDEISWKKIRAKSGGHLYHHIHELDCTLFIMDETPSLVSMAAGNVAHKGEKFGDEDDVVLITLEFESGRFATLQWGSSFHYPEHYVLIEGTKGAILIDMQNTAGYLIKAGKKTHFLVHESQAEDDDRRNGNISSEMDGAIAYGKPGKRTPMWLSSIMKLEMQYLHDVINGLAPGEEFAKLLTGEAATNAIATADAATLSSNEGRKVKLSEIFD